MGFILENHGLAHFQEETQEPPLSQEKVLGALGAAGTVAVSR